LSNDGYVEVSEMEVANTTEEIFAIGDVAVGDFILVKLAA
jgi:thioredoxin reductase